MIVYFAILFGVSSLALFAQKSVFSQGVRNVIWGAIVLILALFAGLRGDFVGEDTIAYINRFMYLVANGDIWDRYGSSEPGYKVLLAVARLISDDPTSLLFISSFVASALYASAILRLSKDPAISVFIFIAFGFYLFHMNGLRQGLALGVYMHALPFVISKRVIAYAAVVVAASLFHVTAIFALPLYFVLTRQFSIWTIPMLMVIAAVAMSFSSVIFQFGALANDRYLSYSARTETGGERLTAAYTLVSIAFVVLRRAVNREWRREYDIFLMMLLLGTMIYIVVTIAGLYVEVVRIALYFNVALAMLVPILFNSLTSDQKIIFGFFVVSISCLFYFIFVGTIGGLIPYEVR